MTRAKRPAYQPIGSCGHPARENMMLCDDCIAAIPPLRDEAMLGHLPRREWQQFMRKR